MKKVATMAAIIAAGASSLALAEGFKGELGYQSTAESTNMGRCWNECYGEANPSGFALGLSYDVNDQISVSVDYSDLEDATEDYGDDITVEATRMALEVAYSFELSDSSTSFLALNYAQNEWSYEWDDGNTYVYESDVSGVSVKGGASKNLSDDTTLTGSLSMGFEEGIEVALETALSDKLGMKVALSNIGHDSDDWAYIFNGVESTPSADAGDGDLNIDYTSMRVSATYSF